MANSNISVIIPALNEEKVIVRTLESLSGHSGVETVVVDGGSTDSTLELASATAHRVISAPRGRASQMNAGARESTGEILFFLHADCLPPRNFPALIMKTLREPGTSCGAFDIRIGHESRVFRFIESMANLRSRMTDIPYGDQGLFIARSDFEAIGGFSDIPLMEDMEFALRLRKRGSVRFLKERITVSPRRWLRQGIVRTTLKDWSLALAYGIFRVSPKKLATHYRSVR